MATIDLEQGSCTASDHPAQDMTSPSLLSLPATALAQISQHSNKRDVLERSKGGHPLLAASRSCRDIVLGSIRSIALSPSHDASHSAAQALEPCDPAPWARLLNRACCQATPGLTVTLSLSRIHNHLHELLQPGMDCGGWSNIYTLQVWYTPQLPALYSGVAL
jgi:hypothetical protein